MRTSLRCQRGELRLRLRRTRIASIWFEITGALLSSSRGQQREADVHHDEHVHAHGARDIDGQVFGEAAVDQQPAFALHRREHARRGQAGAHGAGEIAGAHDHRVAGLEIGGDGAKRRGQLVEVVMRATGSVRRAQRLVQLLPLDQPLRQQEVPAAQAEGKFHQEVLVFLLAAERELLARRPVVEGVLPVERAS